MTEFRAETEKFAVIDVGSNSARLMIALRNTQGEIVALSKEMIYCRLAEGLSRTHELTDAAMGRTIEAVQELHMKALGQKVSAVYIFATAAVREAVNRDIFLRRMHKETNLLLDVLSGEREAQVGFAGAYRPGPRGLIDIGGGSTELALGVGDDLRFAVSVPLGAVRALELYPLGDIADEITLTAMTQWAGNLFKNGAREVQERWRQEGSPVFTGVGGTITTLAAMDMRLAHYNPALIQNYELKLPAVERIVAQLSELPLQKRLQLPGLQQERADIIIGGAVILQQFMRYMNIPALLVSDRDNLEGYLHLRLA